MLIDDLIHDSNGILRIGDHREHRNAIRRAVRRGDLVEVLPRITLARGLELNTRALATAAALWDPNAIITGRAAAALSYWPEARVQRVDVVSRRTTDSNRYFVIMRHRIPPELTMPADGMTVAVPELTALHSWERGDRVTLVEALRHRAITAESLATCHAALDRRHRAADRRQALRAAAGNPWSILELDLHDIYRANGITGWRGNSAVEAGGNRYVLDVKFDRPRLAVEVDGYEFHANRSAFETDRQRQAELVAAGWRVLRFTADMIRRRPELVVCQTRAATRITR